MKRQREHWGSRLGMITAAAGSAIGLGTLWQFPYLTGENGGGIFVLVYLVCTFFIGVPVFIIELMCGRSAQRGAVGIFVHMSKGSLFWKSVGWLSVFTSFLIMSYYSVVAGWGLNYVLMSLNRFYVGKSPEQISQIFNILQSSSDITLFWNFLFTVLTVGVVFQGVRKGIEYWSRIMITLLLFLLIALFFYSLTLPGFKDAFRFIFYPDWSTFKPSGILSALGMSFMTLSLGQGIILTYGSYMKSSEDIPGTACIIGIMDIVVSILAGLMIFAVIFTFGVEPAAGPGLVFKTLPMLFSKLPGALVISTAFFILFVFTALTSAIALIEVVAANFMDLFDWSRKKSVLVTGIASFIVGIPSALSGSQTLFPKWQQIYGKTFFDTMVALVADWTLPIGGLMIAVFGGWYLSREKTLAEFQLGSSFKKFYGLWRVFARWVAPVAVVFIILNGVGVLDLDKIFKVNKTSHVQGVEAAEKQMIKDQQKT